MAARPGELLLAWEEDGTVVGDGVVTLPPHAVAVLRLRLTAVPHFVCQIAGGTPRTRRVAAI